MQTLQIITYRISDVIDSFESKLNQELIINGWLNHLLID